jgi:prevent-host-death family protein
MAVMIEISVHEAKTQLSRYLDLVEDGEEILIHRHGKPVARLVRASVPAKSPFGAMAGEFELPEGWDRPLSADEADAFWAGKW